MKNNHMLSTKPTINSKSIDIINRYNQKRKQLDVEPKKEEPPRETQENLE